MDQNVIFQNTDTPTDNPLESVVTQEPTKSKFSIPKNPKIIALMILGVVIVLLFIVSIVVTIIRNGSKSAIKIVNKTTPTPNQELIGSPTPAMYPEEFNQLINTVQQDLNQKNLPDPPQIDDTIGQ